MTSLFQSAARPIKAVVDLAALAHNLALAKQRSYPAKVFAVVKANAYGHGLTRVLPALSAADGLALLELESAIYLRALGWRKPILMLEGFFNASELAVFAEHGLSTVVHHESQVSLRVCLRGLLRLLLRDVALQPGPGAGRPGAGAAGVVIHFLLAPQSI